MNQGHPSGDRYRVDEYFALRDAGLIAPDERVELLAGLVVSMAPQQPLHAAVVSRLNRILARALGDAAIVRVQLPLVLGDDSVPEPDIAIVAPRYDEYSTDHPRGAWLVVEVADSSLGQDRLTKSRIYAAAGIHDYWIVNLRSRTIDWYRGPDRASRVYEESGTASADEVPIVSSLPQLGLSVSDVFPPG